jgi:2-methylcitrate dehydratase PrpD
MLYALDHAVPCHTAVPDPDHDFLLEAYLKPHAGVRHAHYGLEAAIQLHRAIAGDSSGIESIQLQVYEEAATYAGNRAPARPLTGQFSLSLAVAAGLRFGEMGPECYRPERFFDPELRRLEALTDVSTRPELGEHGKRAAVLHIVHRGREHTLRTESIEGGPERPLTQIAIIEKFVTYAQPACQEPLARDFAQRCLSGDLALGVDQIWAALSGTNRGPAHA